MKLPGLLYEENEKWPGLVAVAATVAAAYDFYDDVEDMEVVEDL